MLSIEDPLRQFGEGIALTPQKSGDITLELAVQAIGIVFGMALQKHEKTGGPLEKGIGPRRFGSGEQAVAASLEIGFEDAVQARMGHGNGVGQAGQESMIPYPGAGEDPMQLLR